MRKKRERKKEKLVHEPFIYPSSDLPFDIWVRVPGDLLDTLLWSKDLDPASNQWKVRNFRVFGLH